MKNKNNYWNDKCEEILKKFAKGLISFDEYCELMKKEDLKINSNAESQVRNHDKTRDSRMD